MKRKEVNFGLTDSTEKKLEKMKPDLAVVMDDGFTKPSLIVKKTWCDDTEGCPDPRALLAVAKRWTAAGRRVVVRGWWSQVGEGEISSGLAVRVVDKLALTALLRQAELCPEAERNAVVPVPVPRLFADGPERLYRWDGGTVDELVALVAASFWPGWRVRFCGLGSAEVGPGEVAKTMSFTDGRETVSGIFVASCGENGG